MFGSTVLLQTPLGDILRFIGANKALHQEYRPDFPWLDRYSKTFRVDAGKLSAYDEHELEAKLGRLQSLIQAGTDDEHTAGQLYRVFSEVDRRRAARNTTADGDLHRLPTEDIEKDAVGQMLGDTQEPKIHEDGTIICDWYGDDDAENPFNWKRAKKLYVVATIAACSFVVYIAAPIWTPSQDTFREEFHVNHEYTSLGLALFVFGYGAGPLLFAPLSEIARIGRNPPYVITFAIFMLVTVPTALVKNAPAFMFFRFLQGFFGSPILATGGASLTDVYSSVTLPFAMTAWAYACFVAPIVGPIVASAAITTLGWRFSIWEILLASAPVMLMLLLLPETSTPTILYYRAARLRDATKNQGIRSMSEIHQGQTDFRTTVIESLLIPMKITLLDPAMLFTNVYMMLIYGIYYSFFEAFPLVYGEMYGFNLLQNGLSFIPIAVGTTISLMLYMSYLYFVRVPKVRSGAPTYPEQVLIPGLFSSTLPPIGLFLFGWGANPHVHWIVSMIGVAIYPLGVYVIFQGLFLYLPLCYPRYAASLFAASDLTRCTFAMAAILFARPLYIGLGIGPACSLLAGLMICCAFGQFALYKFGPELRKRSKFTEKF